MKRARTARACEESRDSACGTSDPRINDAVSAVLMKDTEREEQAWNISDWISHVPPLRGCLCREDTVPPLPRWATLFRPWRDWKDDECFCSGVVPRPVNPASGEFRFRQSEEPRWQHGFGHRSARLQAGICFKLECRPEGRRYKGVSRSSSYTDSEARPSEGFVSGRWHSEGLSSEDWPSKGQSSKVGASK
jgi:hypothetical protein